MTEKLEFAGLVALMLLAALGLFAIGRYFQGRVDARGYEEVSDLATLFYFLAGLLALLTVGSAVGVLIDDLT